MPKKKNKDKFTLYLDKELRDKYKELCEEKGHIPSRMIEIFIEKELEKAKQEENAKKDRKD